MKKRNKRIAIGSSIALLLGAGATTTVVSCAKTPNNKEDLENEQKPSISFSASIEIEGKLEVNTQLKINANIKNNSESLSKDLYYKWTIENEKILDNGKKQLLHTFKTPGDKLIKLEIYEGNNDKGNKIINVSKSIKISNSNSNNNQNIKNELNKVASSIINQLNGKTIEFELSENIDDSTILNKIKKMITIDNKYDFRFNKNIVVDHNLKQITMSIVVFLKNDSNLISDESEITLKFNVKTPTEMIDKILLAAIPKPQKNHNDITAKEFYKLSSWWQDNPSIYNYFDIDEEDLEKQFTTSVMDNASVTMTRVGKFDIANPTSAQLKVEVQYDNDFRTKTYTINGFKDDKSWIGKLDADPIVNLKTPKGAISYKGYLEKFDLSDIISTSEGAYRDKLKNSTWNDLKWDIVYQMRFALYQMFSDNFTEINYYIDKEVHEKSFVAVAEGIIKNDMSNFIYGFQFAGDGDLKRRGNVKSGQKVRVELEYVSPTNGNFRPILIDRGDDLFPSPDPSIPAFTESWYWNFSPNPEYFIDPRDPLFVRDLPRELYMSSRIVVKVSINGSYTINERVARYYSWSFVKKNKILNVSFPFKNKQ